MKYRSQIPLNSAPDAGRRISYHRVSPDAMAVLNELGIYNDVSMQDAVARLERHLLKMNVSQRTCFLSRLGGLIHGS